MKSVKRYYFLPGIWATVTNSQVFNWIKLINDKGVDTDCVSLSNRKLKEKDIKSIEEAIGGKLYQFSSYLMFLNDIFLLFILIFLYFRSVFKYDKIIFQTRIPSISFAFRVIGWFYKCKVIYEARGAAIEERIHVNRNKPGKTKKLKFIFQTKFMEWNERIFMKYSDGVICVSNTLKEYYIDKYLIKNKDKFVVFPGAADESLFYLDLKLRKVFRDRLELSDDDLVMVYSGAFNKEWEIPEDVFKFMTELIRLNTRIVFLILTPDVDMARELAGKFEISENCRILKSKFEDVNKYLNAADMSLMLREDVMMNNVASPTKFSE